MRIGREEGFDDEFGDGDVERCAEGGHGADEDELAVVVQASFTDLDGGTDETTELSGMPDLPSPENCVDPLADVPMPDVTMTEHVAFRYPVAPGWFTGRPAGTAHAEFWIRFTGCRPADTLSLPLLVDAAAPVVLELGVPGSATLELTTHIRRRPAPGWLACRATTRHVAHGYHEEDFELWNTEHRLVAQARQLAVVLQPTTNAA